MREDKVLMKYKLTKFLLICYILFLFKPALPLISDWVSHTFNEKQHMMLVHEVHGKFHIHQELGSAGHQSDNEKSNESKYQVEEYLHVASGIFNVLLHTEYQGSYVFYTFSYPISSYQDTHYPPPRLSAQNKISEAACHGSWFGL